MRIYPKRVTPECFNRGASSVSPGFPIGAFGNDRLRIGDLHNAASCGELTLSALAKKRQRAKIDEHTYELRARIFDSFGEDAFRVELRGL